jgi:hypothetical protein
MQLRSYYSGGLNTHLDMFPLLLLRDTRVPIVSASSLQVNAAS